MDGSTDQPRRKHAQILEAAVAEFQEMGYSCASMDRVAARACVSKRTLYKHVKSKENLFQSIVQILSDRFADGLDMHYDPERDIRDQLRDLAWAEGRLLMSKDVMAMSKMIISETLRNPDLVAATQIKVDTKRIFVDMLSDATSAGQLNVPDPDEAATEFVGLLKSKAFWPVIYGAPIVTEAEMGRIVESAVEMMMCRYQSR